MPPRRIACPDCGESVPGGRLSCPSCGALLASVAGVAARAGATANDASSGGPASRAARGVDPAAMSPASIQTQTIPEAPTDGAGDPASTPRVNPGPAIPMNPSSIRQTEVDGPPPIAALAVDAVPIAAAPIEAAPIPAPAAEVSMLADDGESDGVGYDRGYDDSGYNPPSAPPAYQPLANPLPTAAMTAAIPTSDAPVATASESSAAAAGLDAAKMDQALGYATAAGAGMVAFGMFMPWARVVIGSSGAAGIFDTWGLAGPGHILLLAWAVVILIVSVIPNGIPVSIRSGLAGLALGIFSLGLVWPYLVFGPLGAGIGVWVVALGALVLTGTGIASAWHDRHAATDESV